MTYTFEEAVSHIGKVSRQETRQDVDLPTRELLDDEAIICSHSIP